MKSLLKLHAQYFATLAAKDAARDATNEDLIAIPYGDDHFSGIGLCTCQRCAEKTRRHRDWIDALDAHRDAERALMTGLFDADWGPQADGSFVRVSSIGYEQRTLCAPAKQGELASVKWYRGDRYHNESYELLSITTQTEAMAKVALDRARRRVGQAVYETCRLLAGEALSNGQGLPWHHGQEGGCVEFGEATVSARGALRAAGRDRDLIDSFYEYVNEIEAMCDRRFGRWSYSLQWKLFIDGAMATAPDGTQYAFGEAARALCDRYRDEPTEPRLRGSQGKIAWYVGRPRCPLAPTAEQRRMSKRLARRAARRHGRAELLAMM